MQESSEFSGHAAQQTTTQSKPFAPACSLALCRWRSFWTGRITCQRCRCACIYATSGRPQDQLLTHMGTTMLQDQAASCFASIVKQTAEEGSLSVVVSSPGMVARRSRNASAEPRFAVTVVKPASLVCETFIVWLVPERRSYQVYGHESSARMHVASRQ